MEPSCLVDDAEFLLPPEFLSDDDFFVEKENKEGNKCMFPYEPSHAFGSAVKPIGDEESYLTGLSRKMVQSSLGDDFFGGYDGKAWGTTRCGGGYGCPTRVSSQAAAWDLYCAATEELSMMNLNGYSNHHSGRGLLDLPRKHHPLAAAKTPNDGSGHYSRQSLQYQKLQAIQFQQLKLQQLMKHRQQNGVGGVRVHNNTKLAGHVDLSLSAWCNHPQRRDGSNMRAVFLGNQTGKRGSTGTGVFLPRCVNQTSPVTVETREKPTLATVLVPARVANVLNLDDRMAHQTSASLNDVSWRQRSNNGGYSRQMKIEQAVNEPRLPSDWAY